MAVAYMSAVRSHHHNMALIPLSTGISSSSASRFVAPALRSGANRSWCTVVNSCSLSRCAAAKPTFGKRKHGRIPKIDVELNNLNRQEHGRALSRGAVQSRLGDTSEGETLTAPDTIVEEEELSRDTLIWRAAKPPLYTVALVPCSVAAATAYLYTGTFLASRYSVTLLSGMLIIAWLNLSNDVFDFKAGVDGDKKESVVNLTGRVNDVYLAGNVCLGLAVAGFSWTAQQTDNWWILALIGGAVACGVLYQIPPFRLCHKGLGEPLAFLAAGPFMTTAFYLCFAPTSESLSISLAIIGASVLVGITTSLILFCSHFHQIEGDFRAGKISPLVRLGTLNGSRVVKGAVIGLYTTVGALVALKALPVSCLATSLLTVPIGKLVVDFVAENHADKSKIFMAKYFVIRLHIAHGLALVLGLLAGAWQPLQLW